MLCYVMFDKYSENLFLFLERALLVFRHVIYFVPEVFIVLIEMMSLNEKDRWETLISKVQPATPTKVCSGLDKGDALYKIQT